MLTLSLLGCGPVHDRTIDRVYDPCAASPDISGLDAERASAIESALSSWSPFVDELRSGAGVDPVVIRFQAAAPMFHGVYDDERGVVFINSGLRGRALRVTIAHELGHAFGLPHVPQSSRDSVMNPNNLVTEPTDEDIARLSELWAECESSSTLLR